MSNDKNKFNLAAAVREQLQQDAKLETAKIFEAIKHKYPQQKFNRDSFYVSVSVERKRLRSQVASSVLRDFSDMLEATEAFIAKAGGLAAAEKQLKLARALQSRIDSWKK